MLSHSEMPDVVDQETRELGKVGEIEFWHGFVKSDRFKLNWCDAVPNPELNHEVLLVVRSLAWSYMRQGKIMDVLDIGSGPESILTNAFHGLKATLKAVDPLANDYDRLWDDQGRREKATRPLSLAGEDLLSHFGTERFDVCHIRNAIDHSAHPITVVEQMINVTREGGIIIIHGFENEAATSGWQGFHQWNMRMTGADLEFEGAARRKYALLETFREKLMLINIYKQLLVNGKSWACLIAGVL